MNYKRWDVVAVPFPFVEGTDTKKRPALIVSTDALHNSHRVYWALMITTAKAGLRADDIRIPHSAATGLPAECVVRPSRLATLSDSQIDRRLGVLAAKERNAVAATLKRYLG